MAISSIVGVLTSESFHLLPAAIVTLIAYTVVIYIYRIWFSPLSSIPGPKLAAATRWYEFYYDAIKMGRYYEEIERMHKVYGPVVRINPYEVHIDDPAFFNEQYNVTNRLYKDPWFYSWLNRDGSIFATIDPDQHKLRSTVIKKAFSVQSISRIESVLKGHFRDFFDRIEECGKKKELVPLSAAFRSIAVDIVTDLALPESMNLVQSPDFGTQHSNFMRDITELALWNRHFYYVLSIMQSMPRWVAGLQGKTALDIVDALEDQKRQARRVIENQGKPISSKDYPVIMNEVYKSEDLPPHEKTHKRLFEEMAILIGAGSETTGHSLITTAYHILDNPDVLKRLKKEIRDYISDEELRDVLSYKQLENLPYLNACIMEGLRLATGVSGRLPRINKSQPTTYHSPTTSTTYLIPAGYAVSMTIRDLHYNAKNFPDPWTFKPERFLGAEKTMSEKHFAAFGRGARSCVGRNLAMAEIFMGIGNLFAKFDVRLAEGVERIDVEAKHDCFAPFVARGRKGLVIEVLS
ncbi:putative cytochrome P450 [Trematosphaeria pertusa]|uniref:Putative cytochrome P450 n=1 Tax=Trematosphaeria pertusa TaxID=390896 RepID=A0A6A6I2S0_9PLEO|nr:putative cytochrome P450 [Trematosphaeria pertusa]KAF2244586.1 putative cytochrome P450 [Trematosphaeria pertusa]